MRVHPFPFRTRKLSSPVPKILVWRRTGKIGQCQHKNPWSACAPRVFGFSAGSAAVRVTLLPRLWIWSPAATEASACLIMNPMLQKNAVENLPVSYSAFSVHQNYITTTIQIARIHFFLFLSSLFGMEGKTISAIRGGPGPAPADSGGNSGRPPVTRCPARR